MTLGPHCSFVPPYLLERIAASDSAAADHCRSTLARTRRSGRGGRPPVRPPSLPAPTAAGAAWVVHTAAHGSTLPGAVVRTAGEAASGDAAVDEAADGITATLALFLDAFARSSYDGRGAEVVLTVHYEQNYDNAFWDGTQLVFGDGDGDGLRLVHPARRRAGPRVHPRGHRVHRRADLPGPVGRAQRVGVRLLRHVRQAAGARPDRRDRPTGWSAQGIFLPGVQARALRDMAAPGTAYDDPTLGQGPAGRRHGRLRRHHRRQRRGPHSTPASPTAPSTSPPPRSAATPGRAPARSGTPR